MWTLSVMAESVRQVGTGPRSTIAEHTSGSELPSPKWNTIGMRRKAAARTHADRSTPAALIVRVRRVTRRMIMPTSHASRELPPSTRIRRVWMAGNGCGLTEEQLGSIDMAGERWADVIAWGIVWLCRVVTWIVDCVSEWINASSEEINEYIELDKILCTVISFYRSHQIFE